MVDQPTLALGGASANKESSLFVMYSWSLWSGAVLRTERAEIMALPNDLMLVGYLCRLRYCWQVCLRVDDRASQMVAVVATMDIHDAAPGGWWEIGRRRAGEKIAEWLAANGGQKIANGVELRKAA